MGVGNSVERHFKFIMGACVVRTKKKASSLFSTVLAAGTFLIDARQFGALRLIPARKKPLEDEYFETDKLLYQEDFGEEPLGLLSPDEINNLLAQDDEPAPPSRGTDSTAPADDQESETIEIPEPEVR